MELKHEEENLTMRYLLGDLSEAEKQQIEERFFHDDAYYESLLVAEDELIYTYLCGALRQRERALFETQLEASVRRREKVAVVKALMAEAAAATKAEAPVVAAPPQTHTPDESASWWQAIERLLAGRAVALQFAMAAAMLLLAIAGVWLWVQTDSLKSQVEIAEAKRRESEQKALEYRDQAASRTDDLQARNQTLNEQLLREREARQEAEKARAELQRRLQEESLKHPANPSALADSIISFALESGIRRDESEEPQRLRIPQRVRQIQLQLDLGSDDGKGFYRAEVKTFGGVLVWSNDTLSVSSASWGKAVNLLLPTRIFKNGEYELTLKRARGQSKFEDAGYYYFKIEKP